jgi:hypothetical protein
MTDVDDAPDTDDGVTPEQEAEAYAACEEMERDQREALREGLRALLDGGAEGLAAAVDGICRRISDDGAYALRCAAAELFPGHAWDCLDELPHEVDY